MTYTQAAASNLGMRVLDRSAFGNASNALFASIPDRFSLLPLLNSRTATYLLRALAPKMTFEVGQLERLPVPDSCHRPPWVSRSCPQRDRKGERPGGDGLRGDLYRARIASVSPNSPATPLRAGTSASCSTPTNSAPSDVQAVIDETGVPAGWNPLIVGYDRLPEAPDGIEIPDGLTEFLATLEHRQLSAAELAKTKARLRAMYEAGPRRQGRGRGPGRQGRR